MFIFLFIISCVGATLQSIPNYKEDSKLIWSDKYHVKVLKTSLLSGLVENIEVWYDGNKNLSRLDYNDGTVKKIINVTKPGVMYEIHPITTEYYTNEVKCLNTTGRYLENIYLSDFLPDVSMLEEVGVENISDIETNKFYKKYKDLNWDIRTKVWAAYDSTENLWIPVRQEKLLYDQRHRSLSKHVFYEFSDYKTVVDENVFTVINYCTMDDDKVTIEMKFINPENKAHVDHIFNVFKKKYDLNYGHKEEHEMRKKIFQNSMRLVAATNKMNLGYKLTINRFSDRTEAEINRGKNLRRSSHEGKIGTIPFPYTKDEIIQLSKSLPKEFDLRGLGVIPPIRDQGSCGACWAFAATAAVEGVIARKSCGQLIRLSEQALIDCDWSFNNITQQLNTLTYGCYGGSDTGAYYWIMKHGLPTEEEYGLYLGQNGYCSIENMTERYRIKGFVMVTPYSIEALKVAVVKHGPVSVSIDATDLFRAYSNGILYCQSCSQTVSNHVVTLMGYGERNEEPYWIIRNSYGAEWGDSGYIYISMRDNNCGVATSPVYPVV